MVSVTSTTYFTFTIFFFLGGASTKSPNYSSYSPCWFVPSLLSFTPARIASSLTSFSPD